MPQNNAKHKEKVAEAGRIVDSKPGLQTLPACCKAAGFKLSDRAAIDNKPEIEEMGTPDWAGQGETGGSSRYF